MSEVGQSRREMGKEPREVTSAELLAGKKQLFIHHDGEVYRLMVTRNNRLILQK